MEEQTLLRPIVVVIGLLFIAALSAIVVRPIRFPYTIGLSLNNEGIYLTRNYQPRLTAKNRVRLVVNFPTTSPPATELSIRALP